MPEGVAEIEKRPLARFALVATDDRGLGAAAGRDRVHAVRAAREYVLPALFQPGEERLVIDQAVFGDFRVTGTEFAGRKAVEQVGIGDHQERLVKGADKILPRRVIE